MVTELEQQLIEECCRILKYNTKINAIQIAFTQNRDYFIQYNYNKEELSDHDFSFCLDYYKEWTNLSLYDSSPTWTLEEFLFTNESSLENIFLGTRIIFHKNIITKEIYFYKTGV